MPRRSVTVRREEILDATISIVGERGFAGTRVTDIASALGISSGLVFYHFGTKDELFAAALEHAAQRDLGSLDRSLARADGPVDAIRRLLQHYSPTGSAPGWTIWMDAWSESLRSPDLRRASSGLDVRWKDSLAEQIQLGVTAGLLTCEDPDAAAWRLCALLDGLAVQVIAHRTLTRTRMITWAREAAAAELGIRPDQLA